MTTGDWLAVVGLVLGGVGLIATVGKILSARIDRVDGRVDRIVDHLTRRRKDEP